MQILRNVCYENGVMYAVKLDSGLIVECADTCLPLYTKYAMTPSEVSSLEITKGSKRDRWILGISCMVGCPVRCIFCDTGNFKKVTYLSAEDIIAQVEFILSQNSCLPQKANEFKIEYTCMGEPFLNIDALKMAIAYLDNKYTLDGKPFIHHYISTIGIKNADFSWIKDNMTLQISVHSLTESRRNDLIPFKHKMGLKELGEIRTKSNLKTTLNLALIEATDFDVNVLKQYFDTEHFFVKLSPIYPNTATAKNHITTNFVTGSIIQANQEEQLRESTQFSDNDAIKDILHQLEMAGYDYALAIQTQSEIDAGAACGQLAALLQSNQSKGTI